MRCKQNPRLVRTQKVYFSVDADLINRLGLELVSKQETAVAELVKNAYDADATEVKVTFSGASTALGGILTIEDNGAGMDEAQLKNGFLRIATTDKLHDRISQRYQRPKAGKKGIGRFATQRLGKKLIIITQKQAEAYAYQLTINWDDYSTDQDLQQVSNTLEIVEKTKPQGTDLIIEDLRDVWSEADIKRVYRYVAELLQPYILKVSSAYTENLAAIIQESKEEIFEVSFWQDVRKIADAQEMIFDKAIAKISGYIDEEGKGVGTVISQKFGVNDSFQTQVYPSLERSKIAFEAYYFIRNRVNYYQNITRSELKSIESHLDEHYGIKVFRNGFKVPPYGDKGNDWLGISKISRQQDIPFGAKNWMGFVQIKDSEGAIFEEVAGREGLIEKVAFDELQQFMLDILKQGFNDFAAKFKISDEFKEANQQSKEAVSRSKIQATIQLIDASIKVLTNETYKPEDKEIEQEKLEQYIRQLILEANTLANETEMMRVLAGVGLMIAEFIHEVKQFGPSFNGYLSYLLERNLDEEVSSTLKEMQKTFTSFQAYTSYFDASISQNIRRELRPVSLGDTLLQFKNTIQTDLSRRNIIVEICQTEGEILTCPMHPSEWNTILQNLYSNAKKAILRAEREGKILIVLYAKEEAVYLSFHDNGSGLADKYKRDKERIFRAFETTSLPVGTSVSEEITGSGLGLYIVKQIIINRDGKIWIDEPKEGYQTCFTIKLPQFKAETTT